MHKAAGLTAKIRSSIVCTQTIIDNSVQPKVNQLITMQSRQRADARRLLQLTPNGTALLAKCIAHGFTVSERTLEPLNSSDRTSRLDLLRRIS